MGAAENCVPRIRRTAVIHSFAAAVNPRRKGRSVVQVFDRIGVFAIHGQNDFDFAASRQRARQRPDVELIQPNQSALGGCEGDINVYSTDGASDRTW